MHGLMSYRCFARARSLRGDRALDRYVATELQFELGPYVATELLLELGRYVATDRNGRSVATPRLSAITLGRMLTEEHVSQSALSFLGLSEEHPQHVGKVEMSFSVHSIVLHRFWVVVLGSREVLVDPSIDVPLLALVDTIVNCRAHTAFNFEISILKLLLLNHLPEIILYDGIHVGHQHFDQESQPSDHLTSDMLDYADDHHDYAGLHSHLALG
ncbi:hypothetical protein F2Q69_00047351 [Brassica cretica]|uniref:Uncharacterized protein n=1 Tax=Brassica cretica TaxID=69181 RepID=A0A8S9PGY7_BRACR|nr:hypothetical protein F2Q69_00047351 [Brassica cretica]